MGTEYIGLKSEEVIDKWDAAIQLIRAELIRACTLHKGQFNSYHEGYAVLLEEVDELWDEIKKRDCSKDRIREEAIQVGAMAARLILDCCE